MVNQVPVREQVRKDDGHPLDLFYKRESDALKRLNAVLEVVHVSRPY